MKNIKKSMVMIALLFIFTFFCNMPYPAFAENSGEEYICIVNYCYLYCAPSFSSGNAYNEDKQIAKVLHKDIVLIESEDGSPILYGDSQDFYKIINSTFYTSAEENATQSEAYIFLGNVTKNIDYIKTTPSYNASINSDNIIFYKKSGETKKDGDVELDNNTILTPANTLNYGTRIYLYKGYNSKLEYTQIVVEIDGSLQYGYVATTAIQPDGVNPLIIYAVTIALGCIGIITALLLMKNKKKKVT